MSARPKGIAFVLLLSGLVLVRPAGGVEPGSPLKLDLDKCVQMAVEGNTSVLKAEYGLDLYRNGVISSASNLLPSARWRSSSSRSKSATPRLVDGQFVSGSKSYSSSFSVDEGLSAASIMGVFESLANRNAAEQDVRAMRQDVSYNAKKTYLEVLKAKRLLSVKEETFSRSKKRLERAQAMLDVGSGVRSDVLRAQVEMSSNELDLITQRNNLRLAETALKSFLRIPDDQAIELDDILEAGEATYELEAALADAMEMRPDIKAGMQTVRAGKSGVWKERGGWIPTLSYGWARDYMGSGFPERALDIWDEAGWKWGLGLSVNLFDGFGTFSRVRMAKAQLRSANEDLNQMKRDAALEVKQAFYNVEEARQRVKVSAETVSLAQEELRLAEERYRLGGGTMLEQIDAQVALSEAETSNIQALYDYLLSQAALVKAMGKD